MDVYKNVEKSIIYYTDNRIGEPIVSNVQKTLQIGLPIISVSLKNIDFGKNLTLPYEPSFLTMMRQIFLALTISSSKYVFFCEHDVLYPNSHFDFTPPRDDVFYYNENVWRWDYPNDRLITYDRLISLSGLCVNRDLAYKHYEKRLNYIIKNNLKCDGLREPEWARKMGYEPGTKKIKRGGFTDDDFETWKSDIPMIDIRHRKTYSPPKIKLERFKHAPTNWRETTMDKIEGWDLKGMFNL